MPLTTKILFIANILGLALFLGMAFLLPLHSEAEAQKRFQALEQQGTLTAANAGSIADTAVTGEQTAANIGIGLTLLNVSLFSASMMKKKKKS